MILWNLSDLQSLLKNLGQDLDATTTVWSVSRSDHFRMQSLPCNPAYGEKRTRALYVPLSFMLDDLGTLTGARRIYRYLQDNVYKLRNGVVVIRWRPNDTGLYSATCAVWIAELPSSAPVALGYDPLLEIGDNPHYRALTNN